MNKPIIPCFFRLDMRNFISQLAAPVFFRGAHNSYLNLEVNLNTDNPSSKSFFSKIKEKIKNKKKEQIVFLLVLLLLFFLAFMGAQEYFNQVNYELVIKDGLVIDPETGLQAIRHIGIIDHKIVVITTNKIFGKKTISAEGLIVSPGFIDLNVHNLNETTLKLRAYDGVSTALEMEGGVADMDEFTHSLKSQTPINVGTAVGHMKVRMKVMRDFGLEIASGPAAYNLASKGQLKEILNQIKIGLEKGAIGIGMALAYTPGASYWEVMEVFRLANYSKAPVHIHLRSAGVNAVKGFSEVISASMLYDTPVHVVHLNSIAGKYSPRILSMMELMRKRGMEVSTEIYPYTRVMTSIESSFIDINWLEKQSKRGKEVIYVRTGEFLNTENFFSAKEQGGWVIFGDLDENILEYLIKADGVMVASDSTIFNDKGHPRTAGSFSRVLAKYVRERKILSLMEGINRLSYLPAAHLQKYASVFKNKGRLQENADADIVIFDINKIQDRATYQNATIPSQGVQYLIVNGKLVIEDGILQENTFPGKILKAKR